MERQQSFQLLKPACLELLQVVASVSQRSNARKDIVDALAKLLGALQTVTARPDSLDAKLAEYVFVPISHVLRVSRTVPVRALELCLECISVLLQTGWGGALAPELAGQLLILFTFMAKPSSVENGVSGTSEELQVAAFKCMAQLVTEVSRTATGRQFFTATSNIPALGEAVLVTLDAFSEGSSNEVKLQCLAAIQAIIAAIDDRDALANFLPRMVSSLTKVLTPSSSNRAGFRVLQGSLDTMSLLVLRLLNDRETRNLPTTGPKGGSANSDKVFRTTSWLQATASQIKIALANIFKLRHHDKVEVRQALLKLCLNIVQECRASLPDCISMVIETSVTLAGRGGHQDAIESELKGLLALDQQLCDLLRESLHGWVISLPRVMLSKDDAGRRQAIHQISIALRLLNSGQTMIDDLLAENLRNGITSILNDSKQSGPLIESTGSAEIAQNIVLSDVASISFEALKLRFKGQDDMMAEFKLLLREVASSASAPTVAQDIVRTVDTGSPESQLSSFWISVNLLRDMLTHDSAVDDFLDIGVPSVNAELLDDLYVHSLDRLSQSGSTVEDHWHFQALALEVIAMQATKYKLEFRAELSEALYPVLHHLGSPNPSLQSHAITCLNIMAQSCGYTSASELVVANVDYIVNAVGLRLNYGDVSPQAPRVLLMMMRLCGPSLLPYLDDLVGSIFGALDRYHGYPKLVELLFSVLRGMAEEGVKAPQLAITSADQATCGQNIEEKSSFSGVIEVMEQLEAESRKVDNEHTETLRDSFPHEPWKGAENQEGDQGSEPNDDSGQNESPEPPPPAPKTFDILLKISELTQHYLTSSSPTLRTSLLSLLNTTMPALALHENSFLPLINTLWPVLLPRLKDPEAYIAANSLDIIALICVHAGDFMRGRIEGAWTDLKSIHRRITKRTDDRSSRGNSRLNNFSLLASQSGTTTSTTTSSVDTFRPEAYVDAPSRMIWDSFIRCLLAITQHVAIRDYLFDEILDMLDLVLSREDVRKVLDVRNADAVWLHLHKKSKRHAQTRTMGSHQAPAWLHSVSRNPPGKSHWKFVRL